MRSSKPRVWGMARTMGPTSEEVRVSTTRLWRMMGNRIVITSDVSIVLKDFVHFHWKIRVHAVPRSVSGFQQFAAGFGEGGEDFLPVANHAVAALPEDVGFAVLVYGDEDLGTGAACHVLAGTGYADGDV